MTGSDMMEDSKPQWQTIRDRKRQQQAETIAASFEGASNAARDHLTSELLTPIVDVEHVTKLIATGKVSAKAVAKDFAYRASRAHEQTNCITEVLFEEAVSQAELLDTQMQKTGELSGPLHGLPTTLKDQFDVKGVDSSLGYIGRCFQPAEEDSVLVKMLRSLGAIIIAKSNIPQSIMWCETENPLWGRTDHPKSSAYTPGGSSGGEAALLGSQASLLGWGTDLGGSIRIPAHMTGIYGLKPSSSRLPYKGTPVSTEGQEHVPSAVGPMARSLDTIHVAMKSIINLKPWERDARCVPIPWRQEMYDEILSRPLTIGVLYDDTVVRPHPPLVRVLKELVDKLQAAGHDCFEWNADLHEESIRVMDEFYKADGFQDVMKAVQTGGEPFIPHVENLINKSKAISVYEYWQLNKRKWSIQQQYLAKWNSLRSPDTGKQADIVIMPPMSHTAVPHKSCKWIGYTKVWNFVDYPALVLPAGSVCRDDIYEQWDYEPYSDLDKWNHELWNSNKETMAALELPIGVQLVTRRLEEEALLAAGKAIDDILHPKKQE